MDTVTDHNHRMSRLWEEHRKRNEKKEIKLQCEDCGGIVKLHGGTLMSYPPKRDATCEQCGKHRYALSSPPQKQYTLTEVMHLLQDVYNKLS